MIQTLQTNHFTLVLSGGGALGIAHLGILHDLEKQKLFPAEVVGTSMGGVIAACMAIGMNENEIYQEIQKFSSVLKWIKFSFQGNAIIDNAKLETIFTQIFGKKKIKDTIIPLKIIATNLINGNKRVFTKEDDIYIKDAILTTIAIPGIFDEHIIDNKPYGDGFLCENLGIHEATFEHILAVDVLGKNSFEKELPDNFFKTSNVLEMFEKSMRLIILNQTKTHLENTDKNVILIEPMTKDYKTFQFNDYKALRDLGLGLI
ncbi:MAG: patatin-like phospholipase family protein [Sulfurovum sp.]|nr:MAG: patatin-like phospholipase family protein [Sulfurovum sp.]